MYKLVSHRINSACSAPSRFLGYVCDIVQVNAKLGLTTVSLYDHDKYQSVELVVDSECVERIV